MKKIIFIILIVVFTPTSFAKLSDADSKELKIASSDLASVDWAELDRQAEDLTSRADDMLCRLEERIARIEKFQREHGHK